jgi:hypothetical protein
MTEKLGMWWAPLAAMVMIALIIALIIIIVPRLQHQQPIVIPRSNGFPRSNDLGLCIAANRCPRCDEEGFYAEERPGIIYCGNASCRAGFRVENYGSGRVWAEPIEDGPPFLYR